MSRLLFATFSVLVALLFTAASAAAQDEPDTTYAPRLYIDGQLGLLGTAHLNADGNDASDDLEPSGGGVIGIDVPIVPFFSLGGEIGFLVWNTDGGDDWEVDPSAFLDLTFVPRFRIPFGDGDDGGFHGAAYLAGLVGPTFSFPSQDVRDGLSTIGSRIDSGFGVQGGGLLGVQLFFTRVVGIDLAAGYQHHVAWHEVDGVLGDGTVRLDMGQMLLRAGLALAF